MLRLCLNFLEPHFDAVLVAVHVCDCRLLQQFSKSARNACVCLCVCVCVEALSSGAVQCVVSEFRSQTLSICQHLHANFVLQSCIELLEPHLDAVSVAVHVFAVCCSSSRSQLEMRVCVCGVFKRSGAVQCVVSEFRSQTLSICQHLHANFVLQSCVELLEPHLDAVSVAVHVFAVCCSSSRSQLEMRVCVCGVFKRSGAVQCVVSEFRSQTLSICQHLHAIFVLQSCVELLEPHFDSVSVAVHVCDCCVLQQFSKSARNVCVSVCVWCVCSHAEVQCGHPNPAWMKVGLEPSGGTFLASLRFGRKNEAFSKGKTVKRKKEVIPK